MIHNGRPNWDTHFDEVAKNSPEKNIGVTFCGNPRIGSALTLSCEKYDSRLIFYWFSFSCSCVLVEACSCARVVKERSQEAFNIF